jgi:ATP-dependent Clp protease ATP-binding subunit ClpA
VLLRLVDDPAGGAAKLLRQLGVDAGAVGECLACRFGGPAEGRKIDADALATLGIDLATVRDRLQRTFGPGALERTDAACLGITPRLKVALARAIDQAGSEPLADEHVLLGLLSVPDSVAARLLGELGVSLASAQAVAVAGSS